MRQWLATTAVALFVLAGVASSDDTFQGGVYTTSGTGSYGTYTGTLRITPTGSGRFHVSDSIGKTDGTIVTYEGDGKLTGDQLRVSGATGVGIMGALDQNKSDTWMAVFRVGASGVTNGIWRLAKSGVKGTEKVTPVAKSRLLVLPENAVVAVNLDDDDGDGGAGGDGETNIVSDKDDADGVANEDDLLEVKLVMPQTLPAGSRLVLTFSSKVAFWRSKSKTPGTRILSSLAFEAKDQTLWVEGLEASAAGPGETISVRLVCPAGQTLAEDEARVSVARSAFLLVGHGGTGGWALRSWLDKNKVDARTDPVLVRGKDEKGSPQAWAVYVWNTEKKAKIALSTAGSVVAYDGHSNFGLGYAFETNFTRVSQFMNIADAQVPVNWPYLRDHQDHPGLVFEDSEYGDDASTSTFSDPVGVGTSFQGEHGAYSTTRWPVSGGGGSRFSLKRGAQYKWDDHHYLVDKDKTNPRIVIKAGAKDMPAKRWSKLFLNSCYAGSYYFDSFGGHGTLFFTTDEASSTQTSAAFIQSCIEGASNDATLKALNKLENINDYHVFGE